jgi:hypothetical protein
LESLLTEVQDDGHIFRRQPDDILQANSQIEDFGTTALESTSAYIVTGRHHERISRRPARSLYVREGPSKRAGESTRAGLAMRVLSPGCVSVSLAPGWDRSWMHGTSSRVKVTDSTSREMVVSSYSHEN